MTREGERTEVLFPALRPIYDRLAPFGDLALRIVVGGIMIPHGYEHFFGRETLPEWFTGLEPQAVPRFGAGLEPFVGFLASEGYHPAVVWSPLITAVQFLGGIFLVLGLFTRFAAAAIAIFLFVAIFQVAGEFGYYGNRGGWEMPLLWCVAALTFVFRGGGRYALDRFIGREL